MGLRGDIMTRDELKDIINECIGEIIEEENSNVVLTDEEVLFIENCIFESAIEEMVNIHDDEVITEGANLDSLRVFRSTNKKLKSYIKEIKENIKYKEFKEARENVKKARQIVADERKVIEDIEPNSWSEKFIGYLLGVFTYNYKQILLCAVSIGLSNSSKINQLNDIEFSLNSIQKMIQHDLNGANYYNSRATCNNIIAKSKSVLSDVTFIASIIEAIKSIGKIHDDVNQISKDLAENGKNSTLKTTFQIKLIGSCMEQDKMLRKLNAEIQKAEKKSGVITYRKED